MAAIEAQPHGGRGSLKLRLRLSSHGDGHTSFVEGVDHDGRRGDRPSFVEEGHGLEKKMKMKEGDDLGHGGLIIEEDEGEGGRASWRRRFSSSSFLFPFFFVDLY